MLRLRRTANGAGACNKCSTRVRRTLHAAKKAFLGRKPMECSTQKTIIPVGSNDYWLLLASGKERG